MGSALLPAEPAVAANAAVDERQTAMQEVAKQLVALQRTLVSQEQRAAYDRVVTAVEAALEGDRR
jgi:hypothetical protein